MAEEAQRRPDAIEALDHTELLRVDKRIWTFGDIPLPVGIYLPSIGAFFATFITVLIAGYGLSRVPGMGWADTLGLFGGLVLGVVVAAGWDKIRPEGMRMSEWAMKELDYRIVQPKRFHGHGRMTEPTTFHWHTTVYRPEWQDADLEEVVTG